MCMCCGNASNSLFAAMLPLGRNAQTGMFDEMKKNKIYINKIQGSHLFVEKQNLLVSIEIF